MTVLAESVKVTKERTKVVLRHIPPGFTKDSLLELLTTHCQPFPEYNYYYFSPPDFTLAPHSSCRAYFNFAETEGVIVFKNKFDGVPFKDCNKVQMMGMVEYAPFQRVPKRSKRDIREGTVEKDPDFIEFLETLKVEPDTPPNLETIVEEIEKRREQKKEEQSTTALLDFIKARREGRSVSPGSKGRYRGNNRDTKFQSSGSRARGGHRGRQNSAEEKLSEDRGRRGSERGRASRTDLTDTNRTITPDVDARGRDRYNKDVKRVDYKDTCERLPSKSKDDQDKPKTTRTTTRSGSGERYKRKGENGAKRVGERKEDHSPARRDEPCARNAAPSNPRPTSSKYKSMPEKAIYVPGSARRKESDAPEDNKPERESKPKSEVDDQPERENRDNKPERDARPERDNRPERDTVRSDRGGRDNRDDRPSSRDQRGRPERDTRPDRGHSYRRDDYDSNRGDRYGRSDRYNNDDDDYERSGRGGYRGNRGGYGRGGYRGSNYREDRGRGGRSRGRGRGRD